MPARAYGFSYAVCLIVLVACSDSKSVGSGDGGVDDGDTQSTKDASPTGGKSSSSGGSTGSAQGGKTGSTTSGASMTSGAAGNTGSSDQEDAGPAGEANGGKTAGEAGASGDSSSSTGASYPDDGNQLAVCARTEGDCNKGLACYAPANVLSPGRGYCSKLCDMDTDCAGVSPDAAKYTCTTGPGTHTCEIACSGAEDTTGCPSGLKCLQTAAAMGGGGPRRGGVPGAAGMGGAGGSPASMGQFRCRYPFDTSALWGPCEDASHVCDNGLTCSLSARRTGHCTRSCESDDDCKDKPSSGTSTPSCATLIPARGMTPATKQCVLDCSAAKDGCPTGTQCVDGPRTGMGMDAKPEYSRCE